MKMSEVFDLPLLGGGAVAHAVNQHDQLVKAVKALLPLAEAYEYEMNGSIHSLSEFQALLKAIGEGDE